MNFISQMPRKFWFRTQFSSHERRNCFPHSNMELLSCLYSGTFIIYMPAFTLRTEKESLLIVYSSCAYRCSSIMCSSSCPLPQSSRVLQYLSCSCRVFWTQSSDIVPGMCLSMVFLQFFIFLHLDMA